MHVAVNCLLEVAGTDDRKLCVVKHILHPLGEARSTVVLTYSALHPRPQTL